MTAPLPTLLGLPSELRLNIFSFLFKDRSGLDWLDFYNCKLLYPEEWPLEILQACRRTYNEAKQVVVLRISESTLSYDGPLHRPHFPSEPRHMYFLTQYGKHITRARARNPKTHYIDTDRDVPFRFLPQLQTLVIGVAREHLVTNKECIHYDKGKMSQLHLLEQFDIWWPWGGRTVGEWAHDFKQNLRQKGLVGDIGLEYEISVLVKDSPKVWAGPGTPIYVSSAPSPVDAITDSASVSEFVTKKVLSMTELQAS